MKTIRIIYASVSLMAGAWMFSGCSSLQPVANPHFNTNAPPSASNLPFVENPAAISTLNSVSNTVAGIASQIAPLNPYAGLTDKGVALGGGLAATIISGIAGIWAGRKNQQAITQSLANSVSAQGPAFTKAVLEGIPDQHVPAISDHLNNAPI